MKIIAKRDWDELKAVLLQCESNAGISHKGNYGSEQIELAHIFMAHQVAYEQGERCDRLIPPHMFEWLVYERGIHPDERGLGRKTALIHYAHFGIYETVEVLLKLGANPDLTDGSEYSNKTPLHRAHT